MKATAAGTKYAVKPNSWNDAIDRNAPNRPTKLATSGDERSLKNHTGSFGLCVTSASTHRNATANRATPVNSLTRRDRAASAKAISSDFHHNRQHERPPADPPPEDPLQFLPHPFLEQARVRALFLRGVANRPCQQRGQFPKHVVVLRIDGQAAR